MVLIHHQWAMALDEGRQLEVVLLDSLNFERVSHPVFNAKVLWLWNPWSENYLSQRQQRVVLDGFSSSWTVILVRSLFWHSTRLPLSPLSFVIFICHLPEAVLPGNTIALYADIQGSLTLIQIKMCFRRIWITFINGTYAILWNVK